MFSVPEQLCSFTGRNTSRYKFQCLTNLDNSNTYVATNTLLRNAVGEGL